MTLLEAHIEEFEQGTWVADLIADMPFGGVQTIPASGSFQLTDGSVWVGTKLFERQDRGRYFTKVVGGQGKLSAIVQDQFYQGAVSLQIAVQTVCAQIGELPGSIAPGVVLTQYQQLVGIGSEALDGLAKAAGGAVSPGSAPLLWWIGRDGTLQMQLPDPISGGRSGTALVSGTQDMNTVDVDGSAELVEPQSAMLGALYGTQAVRHIRWKMAPNRFSARLFFVPFVFRPPTQRKYDALYNAAIESDNGDGTVNVIAYRSPSDGKAPGFGVHQVPLFCGVPGSKVKMNPGEQVTLGFFGGDPQKPFCVAMAQDTTATKAVARKGDSVKVTIDALGMITLGGQLSAPPGGGPCVGSGTFDITGTITSGSERLKVGDA